MYLSIAATISQIDFERQRKAEPVVQLHHFGQRFVGKIRRTRRVRSPALPRGGLGDFSAEVALDHRERAAGQIAQPVGQIAVVSRDQRVVGKAAVLPEHNFAQQVIAQRLDAQHVDDGPRPHHVAARLAHLLAVKQQPAVRPNLLRAAANPPPSKTPANTPRESE